MRIGKLRKVVWLLMADWERWIYNFIYKHDIAKGVIISHRATLDKGVPGIHIGKGTWILARVCILNHDVCRGLSNQTYIGKHCVIGVNSLIMPGLQIGNQVVVGGYCY